jgi:hypothetical protein
MSNDVTVYTYDTENGDLLILSDDKNNLLPMLKVGIDRIPAGSVSFKYSEAYAQQNMKFVDTHEWNNLIRSYRKKAIANVQNQRRSVYPRFGDQWDKDNPQDLYQLSVSSDDILLNLYWHISDDEVIAYIVSNPDWSSGKISVSLIGDDGLPSEPQLFDMTTPVYRGVEKTSLDPIFVRSDYYVVEYRHSDLIVYVHRNGGISFSDSDGCNIDSDDELNPLETEWFISALSNALVLANIIHTRNEKND